MSFRASRQGKALHRIKPAFGGASREICVLIDFSTSSRQVGTSVEMTMGPFYNAISTHKSPKIQIKKRSRCLSNRLRLLQI
jgi:hypothetical protein